MARPHPFRFAAAAALYDPSPMLRLQATKPREERPTRPRPALNAETGAALLLVGARTIAGRQFRARGTSHPALTPMSIR